MIERSFLFVRARESAGNAVRRDGHPVDRPVIERARSILLAAGQGPGESSAL